MVRVVLRPRDPVDRRGGESGESLDGSVTWRENNCSIEHVQPFFDATGITDNQKPQSKMKDAIHNAWVAMRQRCNNPECSAYPDYGGRGITVCERWESFENFRLDMGSPPPGTSLDRKENDKGYYPENCRWATAKEQARNRRNTRWITAFGKTMILTDWANERGLRVDVLCARLNDGWPVERALTQPVRKIGKAWQTRRIDLNLTSNWR